MVSVSVFLIVHLALFISLLLTSCKYPSSGRSKLLSRTAGLCPPYLSRFALDLFSRPFGPLSAEVRSFISIHQVSPATALLLLQLLLRAWFIVVRQVSLSHEFYYTERIDKWPWPWPWLKHSLDQHESLCQVWSWSAQPFGRPLATHR